MKDEGDRLLDQSKRVLTREQKREWRYTHLYNVVAIVFAVWVCVASLVGLLLSPIESYGIVFIETTVITIAGLTAAIWIATLGEELVAGRRRNYKSLNA